MKFFALLSTLAFIGTSVALPAASQSPSAIVPATASGTGVPTPPSSLPSPPAPDNLTAGGNMSAPGLGMIAPNGTCMLPMPAGNGTRNNTMPLSGTFPMSSNGTLQVNGTAHQALNGTMSLNGTLPLPPCGGGPAPVNGTGPAGPAANGSAPAVVGSASPATPTPSRASSTSGFKK